MRNMLNLKTIISASLLVGSSLLDCTQIAFAIDRTFSEPQRNLYFGDIHVHTSFDIDSRMGYNTNNPDDAYRFAKGEATLPIAQAATNPPNASLKISTPLDFAAVTSHSEMMADTLCLDKINRKKHPRIYDSDSCKNIRAYHAKSLYEQEKILSHPRPYPPEDICPPQKEFPDKINPICVNATKDRWKEIQKIADKHYEKGSFTTFIGYEYTPHSSSGGAFHRNIIFRNNSVPDNVLSAYNIYTASELWRKLDETCNKGNNCQALVIPHMSNLSDGMFFAKEDRQDHKSDKNMPTSNHFTLEDYKRRMRLEPLIEIHQTKGNSECLSGAGTTDEFCHFESQVQSSCDKFDQSNYPDVNCRQDSYIRNGLKKGLMFKEELISGNNNPFKYGFIGGTDNQNGTPGATEEYQYMSQGGVAGATPKGRLTQQPKSSGPPLRAYNPGGLVGVWAQENSREAIFDALIRKEVFATSGTRISVRFFAGWNYPSDLHQYSKQSQIEKAYKNGVPMGGDISQQGEIGDQSQALQFLVLADKDPQGANLQRLQIVKGWVDTSGVHEQVYDVACSDGLKPNNAHRCPDNGAKVDLKNCHYSNSKGATELKISWTDPDFNPLNNAFYYVRVLENPTCRWSTYDSNTLGIAPLHDVPSTIQERAWSSPIWYTPHWSK